MTMKIFYAFLMVLFISTMPVFAQDQPSSGQHQPPSTADIVTKMQSKLNLTQDQITAVTPIIEKYATKREDIRQSMQDGTADRDSLRSQMKQLKADEKQELSQVLSEEQLNQWEQIMSQGRNKHNSINNAEGPGNSSSNSAASSGPGE